MFCKPNEIAHHQEIHTFSVDASRGSVPASIKPGSNDPELLNCSIEQFLKKLGYKLLQPSTEALATYENPDGAARYMVVAQVGENKYALVYLYSLKAYADFMRDYGNALPVFLRLAYPEQVVGKSDITTFHLDRSKVRAAGVPL